jgi:single-stranded-DNA-specific exonuclease
VWAEAEALLGDDDPGPAVVVAGRRWPSGVVGIVAARLVERYRRPAFVIAIDEHGVGRGSARTHGEVDVYRALAAAASHLERFGGHAAAAGLTVREDAIGPVREALGQAVAAQATGVVAAGAEVDAEVALGEIDLGLAEELARLSPFGKGNEAPLLVSRQLAVLDSRRVGDGSHLKLTLTDGRGQRRSAIGFGLGPRDPGPGAAIDVAFTPGVSTYRGDRTVEMTIRDLAPS